ncbi:MAG: tRNA pseudouridine(38-40) synthase TruA [Thermodesulfovibrionales bacterium]|jgi:tRNA pseudouridine38-40 synthase|nr:tRNA pseudouridine(38-40) synthase TruA [Thermodesulfovibrionales bacterium]
MRNIKLTIQYDGTNYNGWQIQPNGITIQEILQKNIKKITGEDAKLIGAGRTDAGVHAIGQVASFKTSSGLSSDVIKRALNANLPDDIRILNACDAELDFHPRYDAKSKIYVYVISNFTVISPFLYRYAWKVPHKLHFEDMCNAIEFIRGRHDFSAFRASGCSAKNPVRTVFNISIEKSDTIHFMDIPFAGNFLKVRLEADAFLRHMVRNIVGTIVEIGKGKTKSEEIREIINSKDRRLAGPTAPARGLFLEEINY